MQKSAGA